MSLDQNTLNRPATAQEALVQIAQSYLGVMEVGGDNRGPQVEEFQKAMGGKAGDPWCMDFVQFCLQQVKEKYNWVPKLYPSPSAVTVWTKCPAEYRYPPSKIPSPGWVAIWQKYGSWQGHCGIVTRAQGRTFETIEGNTSPGKLIDREGDGVFEKSHNLVAIQRRGIGFIVLLGFLDPFR